MQQKYINKFKNNQTLDNCSQVSNITAQGKLPNPSPNKRKRELRTVQESDSPPSESYSDSDSSIQKRRIKKPKIGIVKRRVSQTSKNKSINLQGKNIASNNMITVKQEGQGRPPIIIPKFEKTSVMTSTTVNKSVYSENRIFQRWDESGLYDLPSYNETVDKKIW